jgi:polyhydroxybutyrate depolymerase
MLHGYTSSGDEHEAYFRIGAEAQARGIVYLRPDGTRNGDGQQFWNATDACCDFDPSGVDDSGYLAGLVEEVGRVADIDPKRVFVVGHSNGGFMSFRVACDHADLIAGIASLAGATWIDPADCQPTEPVAVLEIHGTDDDTVLYDGGRLTESDVGASTSMAAYPGVEETAAMWAAYDRCEPELTDSPSLLDVDRRIDGPSGPAEATVRSATGCDPGGHVEVWTIPGGSHLPDLPETFAATLLDFLLVHPKA